LILWVLKRIDQYGPNFHASFVTYSLAYFQEANMSLFFDNVLEITLIILKKYVVFV